MKKIEFKKGIKIESNTEYYFKGERLDYHLSDTTRMTEVGEYRFTNKAFATLDVAFLVKGVKNVVLDFGGATLVFHGRILPFIFDECENVTLKNLKMDYDRPFYTQAKVLSCANGEMEIKIDDGFAYYVKDGYLYVYGEGWEKNLNRNDCLIWMVDRTWEKGYPFILGLFGEEIFPNEKSISFSDCRCCRLPDDQHGRRTRRQTGKDPKSSERTQSPAGSDSVQV